MATAKKSAKKSTKTSSLEKAAREGNPCWPGFEPVPGKEAGTKGSCRPEPGKHSTVTRKATQKAAAASKLEKQGKPSPKAKK